MKKLKNYMYNRIFITFSEGEKFNKLTSILNESIKEFSEYNLKVYRKEDFDIKWEPENWKPGFIYIYKMLSCQRAIEEGYDEIVWIDNDIVVTENIDKIWSYTDKISKVPLLPKHRLYNHKISKDIYGTFKEGGRYLEKTLKKLNVNHTNFEDFYLHACFILFNRNTIEIFNEVIDLFKSYDYSEELYPNGDESMLNAIVFRESSKNLGNIFICSEYFDKNIIEKVINSSKESYPSVFENIGTQYELIENNFDNLMFFHGSKDPNLHKYYLNMMLNKNLLKDSISIKNRYINSFNKTELNQREPIMKKDNIQFIMNFVNNPFFEIKGESNDVFSVEFFDSTGSLVYKTELRSNMWSKLNKQYFEKWTVKVTYGNNLKVLTYNAENKNVYIALDSKSLGDNIAWMPYLEEFRKKHNCNLTVSTFWNKLFENKYDKIKFVQPGMPVNNLYAMYKIGWFYNSNMEPEEPNIIPLQKTASNILGLDFKEIKPEIDFTPSDRPYNEKYVAIAPHSTAGLKYWNNESGWQEVVDYLKSKGYKVINISLDKFDLNGIEDLQDKSIENTMNVIHHSEFMIGLSSGLSWLAWGIGKHVVMISNFTEENHEFTSNCTRIINKSVCNSCWNNPNFKFDKGDWNWCPVHRGTERQFECHKSITGEMVINKIKELI